jgi:hypothetical protein
MSSSSPFITVSPLGEIIGFGQESGETFKGAWERMLELHRKMQLKMDLDILIKRFYFGLLPLYQNALDTMVGETFYEHDTEKAYKILNGLAQFPQEDKTGVLTRLDKIEESLKDLTLDHHIKEPPHVELKNDWEPFIEISIGSEKFRAYCDLGSTMSIMPKIVFDLLKIDGMVDYPVFHFHADGTIIKSVGIINVEITMQNKNIPTTFMILTKSPSNIVLGRSFLKSNGGFINAKYGFMKFVAPINRKFFFPIKKEDPTERVEDFNIFGNT